MKKFLVIYYAPIEAMKQMAEATPAQKAEGMKPWMAWAEKCGSSLIDLGTPLRGGLRLNPNGKSESSTKEVTGYSMLQAESMEAVKALMDGHPHLNWSNGCQIEIHESIPLG